MLLRLGYNLDPLIPVSSSPCSTATWSRMQALVPRKFPKIQLGPGSRVGVDSQRLALASDGFSVTRKSITSKALNGDSGNGQLEVKLRGIHRQQPPQASHGFSRARHSNATKDGKTNHEKRVQEQGFNGITQLQARLPHEFSMLQMRSDDDGGSKDEFWKQPDGMGYRSCFDFSEEYRRDTEMIMKDRRKYLLVVAAGGLNQQRNQIVDAVVIARILGAALVVPILQVNLIWGDER